MIRCFLLFLLLAPTSIGFIAGYSARALVMLLLISAGGTLIYAFMFGMCQAAGEADDRAGLPRG